MVSCQTYSNFLFINVELSYYIVHALVHEVVGPPYYIVSAIHDFEMIGALIQKSKSKI